MRQCRFGLGDRNRIECPSDNQGRERNKKAGDAGLPAPDVDLLAAAGAGWLLLLVTAVGPWRTRLAAQRLSAAAALVWTIAEHVMESGLTPVVMASIVSLSGGAMLANVISVVLLVIETVMLRR